MNETVTSGRRRFLAGAASAAAAAGLAAFGAKNSSRGGALPAVGEWPWPKAGLDPVRTAGGRTEGMRGCATVSFGLIAGRLAAALPRSAWGALPPELASFGNGGGPYGSDCGALLGPLLVMNLLGAPATLRQEFYKWYCDFAFPSREWDHLYPFKDTIRSVSGSPLCHESRAIWEGVYLREAYDGTNTDNTRCAKLPRDCVKRAVELINAWKAEGAQGAWAPGESFKACYDCHTQLYRDKKPGGINAGKEDCVRCHAGVPQHGEPEPRPDR
jgi:hypothetical protein